MSEDKKSMKMIMKFDVGADGFQKMIYVLAISAVIVLGVGIYFVRHLIHDLKVIS